MQPAILTVNAGSSSLKFAAFAPTAEPSLLFRGSIEGIGTAPRLAVEDASGTPLAGLPDASAITNHDDAIVCFLNWLVEQGGFHPRVAGHRVVHGGVKRIAPARVDNALVAELAALVHLAPHHQPHNVSAIRALARRLPELPQVACFDTAFHATQPVVARRYALPRELEEDGIRRYGFHGLSYEYLAGAIPGVIGHMPRRVIALHLGNGASLCAILDGRSVATTMGFSTIEGLMMGTRAGSIDPGVLLHLMRERGMGYEALTDLLYNRSGLKGVSGIGSDMRTLLASADPRAAEAIELYCYRILREIGAAAAALGGVDALVFTGGVGERAAPVRKHILCALGWLGFEFDEAANLASASCITTRSSKSSAWVVPTNEELVIARHASTILRADAN